jgi:hypothetical protein
VFTPEQAREHAVAALSVKYRWVLDHVILPAIGNKRLSDVTHADATRLHHARRQTPYIANVAIAIARKMFNLAERWGERPLNSNPFRGIAARVFAVLDYGASPLREVI